MDEQTYSVTAINDGGPDRIMISMQSLTSSGYTNSLNLNFPADEAKKLGVWPGQKFKLTLEPIKDEK